MSPRYFFHDFLLVEWIRSGAANLIRLVPFPREQNDVAVLCHLDRAPDRTQPIRNAFVPSAVHPGLDVIDDGVGILGARVVACNYSAIGVALGNLSHQRTLTFVTIAATPEDDNQLSPGEGASGFQAALESVRSMSVVAQHRRPARDYLQPARHLRHA